MNDGWERVPQAIRDRRTWLGLTQAEAAEKAKVSPATWNLIETGRQDTFRPLTLAGVARALDWEPDALRLIAEGTPPDEVPNAGTTLLEERQQDLADEEIQLSAQGVDLAELAEVDPGAYAEVLRLAKFHLDRARERRAGG